MRRIRDVLRLYFAAALSIRAIARSLGTSPSTVGDYLRRAKVAGLGWPLPELVDDTGLERRLFPVPRPSRTARPRPDWSEVHRELRCKSVTLSPGSRQVSQRVEGCPLRSVTGSAGPPQAPQISPLIAWIPARMPRTRSSALAADAVGKPRRAGGR